MPFDCGVEAEGTRLVCTIGSGPDGFEARYLGLGLANLICALSPQRAILGGGIMRQTALFEMVRRNVQQLLNGYLQVPAALGNRVGVLGAIALAEKTVQADRP